MKLGQITEVEIKEKIRKVVEKNGAVKETENKIFNEIMKCEYKENYYDKVSKFLLNTIQITFNKRSFKCIQIVFNKGTFSSKTMNMYCVNGTCSKCKEKEQLRKDENEKFDKQHNCNHSEYEIGFY